MAKTLEQQILDALHAADGGDLPITITDLARQFHADAQAVLRSARELIDTGRAEPAMVDVHGVPTMYGLLLQRTAHPKGG